ncbi:hypothetical protein BD309DRAFT_367004 [Dichomitus squalens]|nr:hypothetical protein BD309DRAFT_367004 [Dichomitus squalens]
MKSALRKIKSKLCKRKHIKHFSIPFADEARVAPIDAHTEVVPEASNKETQDAALTTSSAEDVAQIRTAVDDGRTALAPLSSPNTIVAKGATAIEATPEAVESAYELWKPVLEKVEIFASLVESIGDLHPYAKIASTVLLSVVKPVIDQDKRDNAMADLLKAMDDLYEFVNKTGRFTDLDEYRKRLLKDMSKKTQECAEFIQDEARFTNFWIRAGSNVISGSRVDEKVREFTEAFMDLRRRFTEGGTLETEIRVANLADLSKIDSLTHVRGAGLDSGRACLEGTRVKTLEALREWINHRNPDAPRVLFLLGGAGTGKSSIAHSIGVEFKACRRLGSFFCFNRSYQAERRLTSVIGTIARDLADWNRDFRHALANVLHDQGGLVGSVDIATQWKELIVKPLEKISLDGPVLVVIDAFDESSSPDAPERRLLLKHLTEGSKQLPSHFRILFTSRPEPDVVDRSQDGHPHISQMILDDNHDEAARDIEQYVRHELLSGTEAALDDTDIRKLAEKAEGLFQWAATACRAILQKPAGRTLKKRFVSFLDAVSRGGATSLDGLYRTILGDLFASDDEDLMERFRSVMAQVFCASSPLSVESLEEMRRVAIGVEEDDVYLMVKNMGSLLWGVYNEKTLIRPHHTSFRDFLTDEARSGEWFVDLTAGHPVMALGCFRVMNIRLSFNICRLDTSYIPNRDISDLESRISTFVPQSLSYASCNWKEHLVTTHPPDLQQELSKFLQEKLLFWVELLSLLKSVNRAAPSLEAALRWYNVSVVVVRDPCMLLSD